MRKLHMLVCCLTMLSSTPYVYSAELMDSPAVVLEKVRRNSVCAPPEYGETAIAWIRTKALGDDANEPLSIMPLILQRTHSINQGIKVEEVKSWYSRASHAGSNLEDILWVQADTRGMTYLTVMPETLSKAEQYIYALEFHKVKRVGSVNLMNPIPGTALPHYALTLCTNLAPGKYILSQHGLVLVGEPKPEFPNLPSFRAEFSQEDYLLRKLTIVREGQKWEIQFPLYKKFHELKRPAVIISGNEGEQSTVTFSRWKSDETDLEFSPTTLEQPFGISTDQPIGEQIAAVH